MDRAFADAIILVALGREGAAMAATASFRKPALGFVASIGALTSLMLLLASIGY